MSKGYDYRPALDGIRAIAVVSVMLYHGLVPWAGGGFLGVDVFFVLSGYLITSLLVAEWTKWGSIDVVAFYVRRARRLLPALFLMVGAIAVWAATVAVPERLGTVRAEGLSALLYVANWRFIVAHQSYFDQYGDPSPFLHTWSLAIEEQYYLFFPLLLIGLLHLARRRPWVLPGAIGGLALLSIVEMAALYDPAVDTSRIYYGTDTRVHELLIGALLAVFLSKRASWVRRATRVAPYLGVVALGAVLASLYFFTDQTSLLYQGGFAGVCLVTAALIASVELAPQGVVGRLLSLRPVVWVGAVSYGLYLWHWPTYIFVTSDRTGLDGTRLLLVRVGVTVVVSALSFYLVERPVRNGALARLPRHLGRIVAAVAMPAALAALIGGTAGAVAPPLQQSPFGPGPHAPGKSGLLVVGDSVGLSLDESFPAKDYPGWDEQNSVKLGCGLAVQYLAFNGNKGTENSTCTQQLDDWRKAVDAAKPQAVVLSLGAWEVFDHVIDDTIVSATSSEYAGYLGTRLDDALAILTAGGAHLYVPNVPCYAQPSYTLTGEDIAPIRNDPERAQAVNDVLETFAAAHPDTVTLVDVASWLCPGGEDQEERDGIDVRYDGVHYSLDGGALVWKRVLMPVIDPSEGAS